MFQSSLKHDSRALLFIQLRFYLNHTIIDDTHEKNQILYFIPCVRWQAHKRSFLKIYNYESPYRRNAHQFDYHTFKVAGFGLYTFRKFNKIWFSFYNFDIV